MSQYDQNQKASLRNLAVTSVALAVLVYLLFWVVGSIPAVKNEVDRQIARVMQEGLM
jgi:hypothetical protein